MTFGQLTDEVLSSPGLCMLSPPWSLCHRLRGKLTERGKRRGRWDENGIAVGYAGSSGTDFLSYGIMSLVKQNLSKQCHKRSYSLIDSLIRKLSETLIPEIISSFPFNLTLSRSLFIYLFRGISYIFNHLLIPISQVRPLTYSLLPK